MVDRSRHAGMEMQLHWQSPDAGHCDRQFFEGVNFRRDVFPGDMAQRLDAAPTGELISRAVTAFEILIEFDPAEVRGIKREHFRPDQVTENLRVYPCPADDPLARAWACSDPLILVWGSKFPVA